MTARLLFVRLALLLGLIAGWVPMTAPAQAARKTEEQIQAEIDARLKAEVEKDEAARKAAEAAQAAAAAAAASAPPPVPVAPPAPAAPAVPARVYKTVSIVLTTSMGPITLALEVERAPITANYFLRYVDEKRLDGTVFYRAFTFAPDFPNVGMIQGGTQNDPKRILKPVAHEPTSTTGLSHDDGAISLAQNGPGTATADFFITIGEMHSLDAKPGGDAGFAVFGHVTDGMDLVRRIAVAPRSPTRGEGPMKGQMLEPSIRIITARRAAP